MSDTTTRLPALDAGAGEALARGRTTLKLEYSRAKRPRARWRHTVFRERQNVESILGDSPSLRREVNALIEKQCGAVAASVAIELREFEDADRDIGNRMTAAPYSEEQVLGLWYPDQPALRT